MRQDTRPPRAALRRVYERLKAAFGHARWWPGESPFEVCVGAILVQNTSWTNVERTLDGLKKRRRLSFRALDRLPALIDLVGMLQADIEEEERVLLDERVLRDDVVGVDVETG